MFYVCDEKKDEYLRLQETVFSLKDNIQNNMDKIQENIKHVENSIYVDKYVSENITDTVNMANLAIDVQIKNLQELKVRFNAKANEKRNQRETSVNQLTPQIDLLNQELKLFMDICNKPVQTIPSFTEKLKHAAIKSFELHNNTLDLIKQAESLPVCEFEFRKTSRPNFTFSALTFPFDIALVKLTFLKQFLFPNNNEQHDLKNDPENADWQWINPYQIVVFDNKTQKVSSIQPELLSYDYCRRILYTYDNKNNVLNQHYYDIDSRICFMNKEGKLFSPHYLDIRPDRVINNYPFYCIEVYFRRGLITCGLDFHVFLTLDEDEDYISFNTAPNIRKRNFVDISELQFFVTPNIKYPLIYDGNKQLAYHAASNQYTPILLGKYTNDIVAVFLSPCMNYIYIFSSLDTYFVRVITIEQNEKELFKFIRPVDIKDEAIIRVVLISETSFLLETKSCIFIF